VVTVTPAAAGRLAALVAEQEIPPEERNLRVALRVGGCSGFSYEIGFDAAKDGDIATEVSGVKVLVAPGDVPHLRGMVIDFVDTVQEQGFKITNPNAKSSCGCGQSFEA
jgi:iron-sulfur cluster assembly accessory protein